MSLFRVGIIGCGRPWRSEGATGFGQGHVHAAGYEASPYCQIVAAADIKPENLEAFCQEHHVPNGYADYKEMLAQEKLDLVSVTLWPHLHAPVVIDVAQSPQPVRAIHCEKPMAPTWSEAQKMVQACANKNIQLTFHHQRRFGKPFRKAKELLDGGAIGQLQRIEAFTSNLFDWGTHWFDMMFMYNNEEPAEWVIGQIDARGGHPVFGAMVEGQGLSYWKWKNGVYGLMITGHGGESACNNRLIGTQGEIEVGVNNGPEIRYRNVETGYRWQDLDVGGKIHGRDHDIAAIIDVVDALRTGREPELSARRAIQSTELIFATYESSRKRGRVDLPLAVDDSPFLAMLESGEMSVQQ